MTEAPPGSRNPGRSDSRIGSDYYDRSDYFEDASVHLQNLDSPFQRYRMRKVLEIHQPGKEARVLDLGTGWGTFLVVLAPRVREIVGLDFSQKAVTTSATRVRRLGLRNVHLVRSDATRTGLRDASFDVVLAADLLEHLYPDQTEATLDECHRVLKPGGRLVVWTPHRGHLLERLRARTFLLRRDPSHVDYKSLDRIRRLVLEREFSIEKAYYTESHVPVLRSLERSLMWWVPWLRRRIAVLARKR